MDFQLHIDKPIFDRIFPFSFTLNKNLEIITAGKSLLKLFPDIQGKPFSDFFITKRPGHAGKSFESMLEFTSQVFIIKSLQSGKNLQFRGEMIQIESDKLLFIGSPWLTNSDDFKTHRLSLTDYALHDAVTDMLQVVKVKDIANSDIRMLNDQLEASESRYRELVEFGSDIIYKVDENGYLTFVNDVAARKMGYTKSSALGKHFSEYLFEDWVTTVDDNFSKMLSEGGQELYFEFPIKTRQGDELWVGQHTQMATGKDGKKEIRAFAKDISERKKIELELTSSELRLSNLIATLQAGVLVEDENRKIVLTNPYFCKLFNIPAPPEAMVGFDCSKSAEETKHLFENPDKFIDRINEILQNKELALGDELHMVDGRILERDYTPIFSEKKYLGHLWQYRDLTERVLVQKKLIKARKEAEAAREAEMQFLAHMSHEIRTPLNAISGMLHLMMDTDLSDDQREFLEIQKSSTDILSGLINDILDISKIESGKLDLNVEKIDVNEILETVKNTFSLQLKGKPVQVILEPLVNNDEYVLGDRVLLNQVLFNIVGNAVKFTEEGTIKLTAETIDHNPDTTTIQFTIEDTGIGISKENQKRIFKRFKQADNQTSVKYGGTGLGLAITRKIIEFLGGEIFVSSTPGKGSKFWFTLDFTPTSEKIVKESSLSIKTMQKSAFNNMEFLVAEDNVMNTYYIKRILTKLNVKVDYVFNGLEALHKAHEKVYDLIFMDIRMPEMDGLTATAKIREESMLNKDTPILALTASAFASQVEKALDAGTNDFLSKPFTPPQLLQKMREVLGSSKREIQEKSHEKEIIDKSVLTDLYGDDQDAAREMFELFKESNLSAFYGLEQHIKDHDFSVARELSHKLKPAFSMIGLPDLTQYMQDLEKHCEASNPDSMQVYLSIKNKLESAMDVLEQLHS